MRPLPLLTVVGLTLFASLFGVTVAEKREFYKYPITEFDKEYRYEAMYSNEDAPRGSLPAEIRYFFQFEGRVGQTVNLVIGKRENILGKVSCDGKETKIELSSGENSDVYHQKIVLTDTKQTAEGKFAVKGTGLYASLMFTCDAPFQPVVQVTDGEVTVGEGEKKDEKDVAANATSADGAAANATSADKEKEKPAEEVTASVQLEQVPLMRATGQLVFQNPYGFLPGHKWGYMGFNPWMAVAYGIAMLFWFILCMHHQKETFGYHYCILGILAFGTIEFVFESIDMQKFNLNGYRYPGVYLAAKLFSLGRKTLSRVAIVLVSTGVGIVIPDMKEFEKKLLYGIALLYFIVNLTFEMHRGVHYHTSEDVDFARMILHSLLIYLDGFVYLWVFYALYRTLSSLRENEEYKIELFNKFTIVIIVACLATVIFTVCEFDYQRRKEWTTNDGWQIYWFIEDGYWTLQYSILLGFVMFFWKPTRSSSLYAYCEQVPTEEDGEKGDEENDPFSLDTDFDVGSEPNQFAIESDSDSGISDTPLSDKETANKEKTRLLKKENKEKKEKKAKKAKNAKKSTKRAHDIVLEIDVGANGDKEFEASNAAEDEEISDLDVGGLSDVSAESEDSPGEELYNSASDKEIAIEIKSDNKKSDSGKENGKPQKIDEEDGEEEVEAAPVEIKKEKKVNGAKKTNGVKKDEVEKEKKDVVEKEKVEEEEMTKKEKKEKKKSKSKSKKGKKKEKELKKSKKDNDSDDNVPDLIA